MKVRTVITVDVIVDCGSYGADWDLLKMKDSALRLANEKIEALKQSTHVRKNGIPCSDVQFGNHSLGKILIELE